MNTSAIVVIVVVAVVLVAGVLVLRPMLQRRRLRGRFGEEYDRVIEQHDSRTEAERELRDREKRYADLDIRPLTPESRERYTVQWTEVQARFVDEPQAAVRDADGLVTRLMAERGYPTEGYEQQLADLSIEHSRTLGYYRSAHETHERIERGDVTTEDLRAAMVHYRNLFTDLLGTHTRVDPDSAHPEPDEHDIDDRVDGRVNGADPARHARDPHADLRSDR